MSGEVGEIGLKKVEVQNSKKSPSQDQRLSHNSEDIRSDLLEVKAREVVAKRRLKSEELFSQGKTLKEFREAFNNDYSVLDDLYKEKTGVSLITDPYEAAEHPIPIDKSCSIVIPAYNSGEQLKKTLLAIQASTFNAKYPQKIEVIIVDDGSPKVTVAEVVKETELTDLNVKVLRQDNGRENKARYSGVLAAKGDIILFTSQDIVYSPTTIEEFMKRHQALDGIVAFGLQHPISIEDDRLNPIHIAQGSLGDLPHDFDKDVRVMNDGMVDSDWLKKGGHNVPLPADIHPTWSWNIASEAWGQSVTAPREALLRTICSTDDRYKGYGLDDEHLITDLIAEGYFVIPNTGGIPYHLLHPTRRDSVQEQINRDVWDENFNTSPNRQDPSHPKLTDAKLVLDIQNTRTVAKEPVGIPHADNYTRATTLMHMGLYEKSIDMFRQAQVEHSDYWFQYDYAIALRNQGTEANVQESIAILVKLADQDPRESWVWSNLALSYGRMGNYQQARESYTKAFLLDTTNWQAQVLFTGQGDAISRAEKLKEEGSSVYLARGKPREAIRYLEAALALVGEEAQPWAVFDKGKALQMIKLYPEAIKELEKAKQLLPHETWPDSQLGLIYEEMGDNEKAQHYLKMALEKNPDNNEAVTGLKRIS